MYLHNPCGQPENQHQHHLCPDPFSPWWHPGPKVSIRQAFAAWGDQHPGTHSFLIFLPMIGFMAAVANLAGVVR